MTRSLRALIAAALTLWLAACASAPPVAVDYDLQADFHGLETFYLLDALASGPVAPLELKRAQQATDSMLHMRFRPAANAESADFLVRVQLLASERVAVYEDSLGLYGGHRGWGFGWQVPLDVRYYRESMLVIDVLSPDRSPLWRGSLPSSAGRYRDPLQQQQQLQQEAAQILNRFPPH